MHQAAGADDVRGHSRLRSDSTAAISLCYAGRSLYGLGHHNTRHSSATAGSDSSGSTRRGPGASGHLFAICIQQMKMRSSQGPSATLRRVAGRQWVLKPQDLVVALKLVVLGDQQLSYASLGQVLHLSPFEAHAAVQRLIAARLAAPIAGRVRPIRPALQSFVLFGAAYAYPPVRGEITTGLPTAVAKPGSLTAAAELPAIWPGGEGGVRGQSLLPLYPNAPRAARDDARLYELLSLFDVLRIGEPGAREYASTVLTERLS